MTLTANAPTAVHIGADDLPFVDIGDGSKLKVIQVKAQEGLWIVENIFQSGYEVPTHKHTGPVYAFTLAGSWKYLEYPSDLNVAGGYLFEPAGSVHTLHVPETNTETTDAVFVIHGANLNLDEAGNVTAVIDAAFVLEFYVALCEQAGHGTPAVVGG